MDMFLIIINHDETIYPIPETNNSTKFMLLELALFLHLGAQHFQDSR